jgi:methylenetetrahydrofolate--tRNA-(uracil-5-)-methyltransferase
MFGSEWIAPPADTAHGALLAHITGGAMADSFQPMNVNFGLFPELPVNERGRRPRGRDRKAAYAERALSKLAAWGSVTAAP